MLEAKDLVLEYGGVRALNGMSFTASTEQVTAVVGSNGAGKTTLMNAICGLVKLASGEIRLDGAKLNGLAPDDIVRKGISLVPEGRELFPKLSVLENLLLGATVRPDPTRRRKTLERIFELFPVLANRQKQQAGRMSGGEQQMLAFGRALMAQPKMLLLDEPSIGLAPMVEEQLISAISDYSRESGIGVLIVEQNAMLALEYAQHAYVVEQGRVALSGPAAEIRDDPAVIASYLG
ncbi:MULTISPECIES: ABC transporter ATP-binding protein [unclassified Mesorhizobium]|uniref:ABC transporter ATP-binding protein n=1 Tax=unclassified Mesorhizobium TaxID=325217 RepID=UPI000FCC86C0|nr:MULTISPECIES: ABC transporter ATP-binding protein [unclassified Mesorhizobium]RUV64231.1 ABC transporter ATP-binding protein [Mesorhizobium sp. M5C.F.Ca.IN.020.29.1.1]RWA97204.1 MAG: ABC transporter ATP-binding protein [Mesorhizobium sp.]RWC23381.1 MAG: ABC transporter ATP-binding protein [Mesorhizobium sp.]RWD76617.1 MAG: ABC transporter ATP-binding protein [Mesorhizobium sp.]RWE52667.1 MAG: ABC transporter ATP-binding protein [Mesorhizobium sp.]